MSDDSREHLKHGKIRMLRQSDMLKCPFCIMVPGHYRQDGTCKCNDPEHRKMMIAEWGYNEADFRKAGVIP
jgi:hypothetical protein